MSDLSAGHWAPVHVEALDGYRFNRALMAIMDHLGVRLESRFGGDGVGMQWRVVPLEERTTVERLALDLIGALNTHEIGRDLHGQAYTDVVGAKNLLAQRIADGASANPPKVRQSPIPENPHAR